MATRTFERRNPMTGEVASSAPAMSAADVPAIAARAQQGFAAWSKLGPNARRAVLMKAADALMARKDAFVAAMMGEIGATAGWAMFNLALASGMVREAASLTTQVGGEVIPSDHEGTIATHGENSHGILAQSIGGGGGNVGLDYVSSKTEGGTVGISIGRTGGTGGSGGDVSLTSNGIITTDGNTSYGLLAQSIGNGIWSCSVGNGSGSGVAFAGVAGLALFCMTRIARRRRR